MPGNNLTVVSLYDSQNNVVGYAAGTAEETALAASQVYGASDPVTQTAVQFLKDVMAIKVKDVREAAEADGVLINGNLYDTSFDAQVKYLGSLVFATRDPNYSGEWKTLNNGYVTLDSLGVYTVCSGIMTYLQNCSVWEQDLLAAISAATTVAQLQAIDFYAGKPVGSAGLPPPAPGTTAPPPLEAGSVNVADVVADTCTISGLTKSGSITTTGNITCGGAFSTASFALASVNTGAVTATSVTAGSGTISTTGATNTGSLAVSGNATVTGTLGAGATTLSSLTTTGATNTGSLTVTGTQTTGTYLRSNGTTATLSAIQAADVPTLNQNTTGTAANVTATTNASVTTLSALSLPVAQVTGTLPVTKGGTGSATALTQFGVKYASTAAAEATTTAGTTGLPLLANTVTGPAFGQLSLTAGVTGVLPIANGGTGSTTAAAAITALTGAQTSGTYLRSNGTAASLSAIQAADVPTLNQNTTGTSSNVTGLTNATLTTLSALTLPTTQLTGTLAIANGGTGNTTGVATNVVGTANLSVATITTTGNATFQSVTVNTPLSVLGVTGASTLGSTLSVTGVTTHSASIQTSATNTLDASGTGNSGNAINWSNGGAGYVQTLYNSSTAVTSAGLLVKSAANSTNPVFSVDYGVAQATAGTALFRVLGNGNVTVAGTLGAGSTTVTSLAAGSGAITTTGTLSTGAATVTSLNSGSGLIATTGALNSATIVTTGNGTIGGTLSVTGVSTFTSSIQSSATNTLDAAGAGNNGDAINWASSGVGYVQTLYNSSTAATSAGLLVKCANNTTNPVFSVDYGAAQATAGTALFRVLGNGNVGLGTSATAPAYILDINTSGTNTSIMRLGNSTGGAGNLTGIYMSPFSGRTGGPSAQIGANDDGNFSANILFSTAPTGNGTVATERMRVTSTGLVGIGNTAPAESLDVTGNVRARHFRGNATTSPTIVKGPGTNTTTLGSVSLAANSSDASGQISVSAATTITTTTGTIIATVTFAQAYTTTPFVTLYPTNAAAGAIAYWPHVIASTTGFTINVSNNTGLANATTYTWAYQVIQ